METVNEVFESTFQAIYYVANVASMIRKQGKFAVSVSSAANSD